MAFTKYFHSIQIAAVIFEFFHVRLHRSISWSIECLLIVWPIHFLLLNFICVILGTSLIMLQASIFLMLFSKNILFMILRHLCVMVLDTNDRCHIQYGWFYFFIELFRVCFIWIFAVAQNAGLAFLRLFFIAAYALPLANIAEVLYVLYSIMLSVFILKIS